MMLNEAQDKVGERIAEIYRAENTINLTVFTLQSGEENIVADGIKEKFLKA